MIPWRYSSQKSDVQFQVPSGEDVLSSFDSILTCCEFRQMISCKPEAGRLVWFNLKEVCFLLLHTFPSDVSKRNTVESL